ncbi:hypothetical protein Pa4123_02140 [Phytohabitans aurantiacus]|uniref:Uncharacterized protein n=1 Tax=Phytohabitans aurantiacus TaxID=3016789 RepID=A0ABQ5QM11_9ACTN|nr:hypothetical protein Pa4123_02140 [Phytohabitans aurantiacus]
MRLPLIGASGVATRRAGPAWGWTRAEKRSNHVHSPLIAGESAQRAEGARGRAHGGGERGERGAGSARRAGECGARARGGRGSAARARNGGRGAEGAERGG